MATFRIKIRPRANRESTAAASDLLVRLREDGLTAAEWVEEARLFFLEGRLTWADAEQIAQRLLVDPVTERATIDSDDSERDARADDGAVGVEIHLLPGVMDPVAESTLAELQAEGYPVEGARTARRYVIGGSVAAEDVRAVVLRVLANDCIERVVIGAAGIGPAPKPPISPFAIRRIPLRGLDEAGLVRLSRERHLFLSAEEMRAVQAHFAEQGRDPTDLELETFAQTWSEHCAHKTLKSAVVYHGAPMPALGSPPGSGFGFQGSAMPPPDTVGSVEVRYEGLLRDTIARATQELIAAGRGPRCLSVFEDNAGVIAFDEQFGVAFKVETHNHPSAIEPYGGASTGVGGCIRDVLGCGLGARPIANTDVFCVAPGDWPQGKLLRGVLHPRRILRAVVRGVADYGNRMGIPTVNGAIHFDPRYVGNPLVYCGCVGLIPRDRIHKAARPGDLIVLVGGRTGRDGIHGATFSSAELTDAHADEFSHAVQIGNAITEKRVADAVLRARDHEAGCLFTCITDCGAGGLSSAVGEMAREVGATVDLETVPLKYAGLRYDEIWISEAQERMVLAVPPENLDRFLAVMRAEEAEATVIGVFGQGTTDMLPAQPGRAGILPADAPGSTDAPRASPRLVVRYNATVVGDLDLRFLHEALPKRERMAEWHARPGSRVAAQARGRGPADLLGRLLDVLRSPTVASKARVIRQYDHEVQGGSVVKPLGGRGTGPNDAAVLRPRLDSWRGVALGCGLKPHLCDLDPYWMAAASIDEALRNVVCVGGDPAQTAILDNFCWGRSDDPQQLGALVRACQACYDAAKAYGTPFISGKDSLNNEFALDPADVESAAVTIRSYLEREGRDPALIGVIVDRIRATGRVSIPGTLLISALSLIDDVRRCVTADLKTPGDVLFLVGGLPQLDFSLADAARIHAMVAEATSRGLVAACHDVSDGGLLVALAEMAIGGERGVTLEATACEPFGALDDCCAGYVVETRHAEELLVLLERSHVRALRLGAVRDDATFSLPGAEAPVTALRAAWAAGQ